MTIKSDNEATWEIIKSLSKLYQSRCYVCRAKCKYGKGFAVHHIKYLPTDKIHSQFKSRLTYYTYLEPLVRQDKKRFALLCNTHHSTVTNTLRFKKDKLLRLIKLIKQSI